tara:strand:+ start:300 stop:461 length:162 start_codon:yes stop_codon:yes gene_type:complete
MTFEEWFKTIEEDVINNCDNRMDQWDAENWLRDAWYSGRTSLRQIAYEDEEAK